MRGWFCWLAGVLATVGGCGPSIVVSASGAASTTEARTPPEPSTTAMGDDAPGTFGPADGSGGTDSAAFLIIPDARPLCAPLGTGLGESCFCNLWPQGYCARGEKCMPWADDGGGTWNSARCAPVVGRPAAVGAPCSVEGNAVSGIDDCGSGAMCFHVDPATNEGTCVAFCSGDERDPTCRDGTTCLVVIDPWLPLCLPSCNPLLADCVPGEVCASVDADFGCVPEGSPPAGYGEACEFGGQCTPGLACAEGDASDCGLSHCCTAYCDLSLVDPNPACPDAASGQICSPWYAGEPPPGLENLGLCTFPT